MPTNLSQNITFFEAQPFLKNSHLITHLLVYKNQEIILFTDKAFHIYSYQQMLRDQASLVHIVEYQHIFKASQPEEKSKNKHSEIYHMDEITQIFNNSNPSNSNDDQKKLFGDRIFEDPNDINSNILLQGQHFINRLTYLNSIRVKNVKMSAHGDFLIDFVNGQTIFVQRNNNLPYYKSFKAIDLNVLVKGKVECSSFISSCNNLILIYSENKLYVYDYLLHFLYCEIKYLSHEFVNQIFGFCLKQESVQNNKSAQMIVIMFQHAHKLELFELLIKKKKLISMAKFEFSQSFIDKVFVYQKLFAMYVSTSQKVLKIDLTQLINNSNKQEIKLLTKISRTKSKQSKKSSKSSHLQNKIQQSSQLILTQQLLIQFDMSSPQQMLYINDKGDYLSKCKNTSKQYITLMYESVCGVYVVVTCKKGGNYKQGQLLIGIKSDYFEEMIRKCSLSIKNLRSYEYLNINDLSIMVINTKIKKQTVSRLSKLINEVFTKLQQIQADRALLSNQNTENKSELQQIQICNGVRLNEQQFEVMLINLGWMFQSKQSIRQKHIQKRIIKHFYQVRQQDNRTKNIKNETKSNKGKISRQGNKMRQDINDNKIVEQQVQIMCQIPLNIKQRCIFSHRQILDEGQILQCKICDVYGIRQHMDDSKIYEDSIRNGYHRCYICLNEMNLIK